MEGSPPFLGSGGQPAILGKWRAACHSWEVEGSLPFLSSLGLSCPWADNDLDWLKGKTCRSQSTVNSDQIKEIIDILHGTIRTGIEGLFLTCGHFGTSYSPAWASVW